MNILYNKPRKTKWFYH